jgi:LacI family transcriptional regulator
VRLVRGLKELGVHAPDDFALIAYDNLDWAPFVEPALTCVAPPRYDLGFAAGEMIVASIEGRPFGTMQVLSPLKVVRRSCGCAWSPLDERPSIELASPAEPPAT